jgi:hypothetical protein
MVLRIFTYSNSIVMELQYISDNDGNQTAVIIPINDWNKITSKHQDIKDLMENPARPKKSGAGQFRGILTAEEAALYHSYIKQARSEWDRDI